MKTLKDQHNFFIHPTADVSSKTKIGKNVKIWHQAQIREGVIIGDNCIIGKGVYIDHDVVIGNNVKIQNYACIYSKVIIEDGVFIGPLVCLTNDRYPRAVDRKGKLLKEGKWPAGMIHIKKRASIGAGSIVLTNITIGMYAMVGASSLVTKNVSANTLVFGIPAKVVRKIKR